MTRIFLRLLILVIGFIAIGSYAKNAFGSVIGDVIMLEGNGVIDRKTTGESNQLEIDLDVFSYDTVKTGNGKTAIEFIDQDNDFYQMAFASAGDFRRYWKDFNLHLNFSKKYKNLWVSSNLMYSRSLNYQWDLDDTATEYYHPGNDVNNFHMTLKLAYLIPLAN